MSVLTDNLTLRGRCGINCNYHWDLADWEWKWIAASFGWVRFDGAWNNCELTAGTYTWTYIDPWLAKLEEYDLGAIIILDYANTVVTSYGFTQWNQGPSTDAQVTAFTNWAKALAAHVAGKNVILEIWNEPHGDGFWYPAPNAADYARLARTVTAAIKADYPDQVVLSGGGLAYQDYDNWTSQYPIMPSVRPSIASDKYTGPWLYDFVKEVSRRGAFAESDGVSFHFYQSEWPPEIVGRQIDALKRYVPYPIVDTESGYANQHNRIGTTGYYRPGAINHNDVIGEDTAALYLVRKLLLQAALDVKLTALFSWRNIQTDVYTESRLWPYKPQGGRDREYNTYFGQALLGSYGLVEHDPSNPAQDSINYIEDYEDEWIVDDIVVIDGGSAFCAPDVPELSGASGGTGIVGYSIVGDAVVGDTANGAGRQGVVAVGVVGHAGNVVGEINDTQLVNSGNGYTYGFNMTVTDWDPMNSTAGVINVQPSSLFTGETDGPLLSGSVTTRGQMTAPYLSFTGNLPYATKAAATLVSMNMAGFHYVVETQGATLNQGVTFNGTVCANGVKAYGFVQYLNDAGCLGRYAGPYGSITLGVGNGHAVGDELSTAVSLNGAGSGLKVTVAALLDAALGLVGSNSSYWTVTDGGENYKVGEVVTFSDTTGSGTDGAIVVTSVADGVVTGVRGLYGGTYNPTALPTTVTLTGGATLTSDTIVPFFTPNNIKVESGGTGYTVTPGVKITPDSADTGPGIAGAYPGGATATCELTDGVVTFIKPSNSSVNNGLYFTKAPTVDVVCGYESIYARTRSYGGEVTDILVDGPGIGLDPAQNIKAKVVGGKWPAVLKFTTPATWDINATFFGKGYTDGRRYTLYDLGTGVPVDAVTGRLDPAIWDYVTAANATGTTVVTADSTGKVTAVTTPTGGSPVTEHYYLLGPLGTNANVAVKLKPKPKPRQPSRKANALLDLMGWIGDYEYSENLSADDKAYHLVFTKAGENDVHVLWRTTESVPTGTVTVVEGVITGVTITNPGVGLTEEPEVEFISETGSGASARCLMFDGGLVSAVTIDDGGSGYVSTDTVRFSVPTPGTVDVPDGAVRAWDWTGLPVTLGDSITLTDEPLFIEVED